MTADLECLLADALATPCGIGIRSSRPADLLRALHSALREAGGQHSTLTARMGSTADEVWLAPRALLPELTTVGSLGAAPPIDFAALNLE